MSTTHMSFIASTLSNVNKHYIAALAGFVSHLFNEKVVNHSYSPD